jgi:hypothetical protein
MSIWIELVMTVISGLFVIITIVATTRFVMIPLIREHFGMARNSKKRNRGKSDTGE